MTIVTKYDVGMEVFHKITGERGIITSILVSSGGYTEYRVATGVATYGFLSEHEISLEQIFV